MTRRGQVPLRALVLALLAACTPRVAPPTADTPPPRAPDLTGTTVMVLPAQPSARAPVGAAAAFDAELDYWLSDRAPRVHWIGAGELERLVARSPGLGLDLHGLDVRAFGQMRLTRIGDPLFGDLRRLGVMADAPLAVLPVSIARLRPAADSAAGAATRLEAAVALIDSTSGDVLWFGVVAGVPAPGNSPGAAADLARAVARALVP